MGVPTNVTSIVEHFPKDTELTEDNDFSYEARKRKHYESWYS